jgi:AraC-like DNA-binding protein
MKSIDKSFAITDLDPQLEEILNNFSSIFKIRIAYYLPDGREYKIGSNMKISPYCQILRELLDYKEKCLALDSCKRAVAKETRCTQSYVCHGGCNEAIKPVFRGDDLLGYIMIGQAVSREKMPETIFRKAEAKGVLDDITHEFQALPFYDRKKMSDIVDLFVELTDLVILKDLIRHKEQGPVKKVLEYMKAKDHTINLHQAAMLTDMSESRLRHKIREECGKSFTRIKEEIAMEKAEKLLRSDQSLTVQEASFQLGFKDPFYFSRAFKRFFGHSPSEARGGAGTQSSKSKR